MTEHREDLSTADLAGQRPGSPEDVDADRGEFDRPMWTVPTRAAPVSAGPMWTVRVPLRSRPRRRTESTTADDDHGYDPDVTAAERGSTVEDPALGGPGPAGPGPVAGSAGPGGGMAGPGGGGPGMRGPGGRVVRACAARAAPADGPGHERSRRPGRPGRPGPGSGRSGRAGPTGPGPTGPGMSGPGVAGPPAARVRPAPARRVRPPGRSRRWRHGLDPRPAAERQRHRGLPRPVDRRPDRLRGRAAARGRAGRRPGRRAHAAPGQDVRGRAQPARGPVGPRRRRPDRRPADRVPAVPLVLRAAPRHLTQAPPERTPPPASRPGYGRRSRSRTAIDNFLRTSHRPTPR